MRTLWLPLCPTVAPMARGGGGDITGNGPGQGFTSPSTCTHVQGVSGAPTAAVGGAAEGCWVTENASLRTSHGLATHPIVDMNTQWVSVEMRTRAH